MIYHIHVTWPWASLKGHTTVNIELIQYVDVQDILV